MLDLRQIQYFVCLHEERSVTRAARQLNVVQPALSMQINRLERRLGLTLFDRTARGMIPTAAGEAMYRLYVPILLDLKNANQRVMELSGKVATGSGVALGSGSAAAGRIGSTSPARADRSARNSASSNCVQIPSRRRAASGPRVIQS